MSGQQSFRQRVERLLKISPEAKPRVYSNVFNAADVFSLNYGIELLLSAGIATLGLVLNSPAVVIGAMLVSPLMGPILAAGLALAASDLYLGIKALAGIVASVVSAVAFSAFIVWLLPFHVLTGEIVARTQPNLLDLGVAVLSGLIGSIVMSRGGEGGGVTAMPGVAIAVALMPPLCTVGYGFGSGVDWPVISGAALLFLTNLAAITVSAFVVFYIVRMDAPDVRESIQAMLARAERSDWVDRLLKRTTVSAAFGDIGRMRYRLLLVLLVFIPLYIPLERSFSQVRDETVTRAVVRDAVKLIAPGTNIFNQAVDVTRDRVVVRLVVTGDYTSTQIQQAKDLLLRRTGKEVSIDVRRVAREEDIQLLRDSLVSKIPAPPPVDPLNDLADLRGDLLGRVEQVLEESWPAQTVPRSNAEVVFDADGITVRVNYSTEKPMDMPALEAITLALRGKLRMQNLQLDALHHPPPPKRRGRQR